MAALVLCRNYPTGDRRAIALTVYATFAVIACGAARADTQFATLQQSLQSRVDAVQAASGVPGLSVALVDADHFVAASAGLRAAPPATPSPLLATDSVHIGSNFKAFTATVVGRLVDRGLLGWDTSLGEVFAGDPTPLDAAPAAITLRQLLSHRSGLDDEAVGAAIDGLSFLGTPREVRAASIPLILNTAPRQTPGEFLYSNVGYAVVGAVVEKVTGRDFVDVVQSEIAGPLGITTLRVGPPGSEDLTDVVAPLGHDETGAPVTPAGQALPVGLEPAGDFRITLEDWAKFIRVQLRVDDPLSPLLSRAQLDTIQTPIGGPVSSGPDGELYYYSLGWVELSIDGAPILYHNGSNSFWLSSAFLNPATGRALLTAGNQEGPGGDAAAMLIADPEVRSWLLGVTVPEPTAWLLVAATALVGGGRGRA